MFSCRPSDSTWADAVPTKLGPIVGVLAACIFIQTANLSTSAASTVNSWNIVGGGSWSTVANWSAGHIPNSQEDATIGSIPTSLATPVSIPLDANQTAYGLTLDPS